MEEIEAIAKLAEAEAALHAKNHQLRGYSARLAERGTEIQKLTSEAARWKGHHDVQVEMKQRMSAQIGELHDKLAEVEKELAETRVHWMRKYAEQLKQARDDQAEFERITVDLQATLAEKDAEIKRLTDLDSENTRIILKGNTEINQLRAALAEKE